MKTTKIASIITLILSFLLLSGPSQACVGRSLYVGAMNTAEEKMLAELLVLLINERTGTTVKVRVFDTVDQLYAAAKSNNEEERVDILVEDTADAATVLKRQRLADSDQEYLAVKSGYEKDLDIVWLNPFGFTNGRGDSEKVTMAPLVRRDVLTNFPLLPRVLNKLAGAIDNKAYADLAKSARAGDKPKNIAKDFLREKKFI